MRRKPANSIDDFEITKQFRSDAFDLKIAFRPWIGLGSAPEKTGPLNPYYAKCGLASVRKREGKTPLRKATLIANDPWHSAPPSLTRLTCDIAVSFSCAGWLPATAFMEPYRLPDRPHPA